MVKSRQSTSAKQPPLEEWTIREKLCLASLALKYNNSWSSVARNMITFGEKNRPDGWFSQKSCAAQFDKLITDLGADRRPKRSEQTDSSGSLIYKKMVDKRVIELEESITETRKAWLKVCNDLKKTDGNEKAKPATSTRALTRRQNLEKTLSALLDEACKLEAINQLGKPSEEVQKTLGPYDKLILKHKDLSSIREKAKGEISDPYAVLNDILLLFQNQIMYYPIDHPVYKTATELRERFLPHWERSLLDRIKSSRFSG